jgi:hypothetical protein
LKFLCDADVDSPLVEQLRADGHDTLYMAEIRRLSRLVEKAMGKPVVQVAEAGEYDDEHD